MESIFVIVVLIKSTHLSGCSPAFSLQNWLIINHSSQQTPPALNLVYVRLNTRSSSDCKYFAQNKPFLPIHGSSHFYIETMMYVFVSNQAPKVGQSKAIALTSLEVSCDE